MTRQTRHSRFQSRRNRNKRPSIVVDGQFRARWADLDQIVIEGKGEGDEFHALAHVSTPGEAKSACDPRTYRCADSGDQKPLSVAPSQILLNWCLDELKDRYPSR